MWVAISGADDDALYMLKFLGARALWCVRGMRTAANKGTLEVRATRAARYYAEFMRKLRLYVGMSVCSTAAPRRSLY